MSYCANIISIINIAIAREKTLGWANDYTPSYTPGVRINLVWGYNGNVRSMKPKGGANLTNTGDQRLSSLCVWGGGLYKANDTSKVQKY